MSEQTETDDEMVIEVLLLIVSILLSFQRRESSFENEEDDLEVENASQEGDADAFFNADAGAMLGGPMEEDYDDDYSRH